MDSTTQHLTCPAVFIIFIWVPSESISILLLEAQQYFTAEETEEEGDTLVSGIKLFCQGLLPAACLLPKRLAVKFIFKVFAAKWFEHGFTFYCAARRHSYFKQKKTDNKWHAANKMQPVNTCASPAGSNNWGRYGYRKGVFPQKIILPHPAFCICTQRAIQSVTDCVILEAGTSLVHFLFLIGLISKGGRVHQYIQQPG